MRRILALICAGVLTLALAPVALASAPTNDEQSGATVVTVTPAVPFEITQDTTEATANATDPVWMQTSDEWVGEQPTPIGPTVWYVYTAAASGTFFFDVTGSSYTPIMLVLQGDGRLVGFAFGSTTQEVLAGQTYYFVIGDMGGVGGSLHVFASILPAPVNATIGVTGATIVDGQLVVTGTLVATGGDSIWVNLRVEAAQKGKAPVAGESSITDPGETWTVSVPALTNPWQPARTTLTVTVDYYQDLDAYPERTFVYAAAVRASQLPPPPAPELGSVSGRFTFIDNVTDEAVGVEVDLQVISSDWEVPPSGQLTIKSSLLAGTYTPYYLHFDTNGGSPHALAYVRLTDGNVLLMGLGASGTTQWANIQVMDDTWTTMFQVVEGTVTKKGFTIIMPAT